MRVHMRVLMRVEITLEVHPRDSSLLLKNQTISLSGAGQGCRTVP